MEAFGNLPIERPPDVAGIRLVIGVRPLAGVADGLYVGVGKPSLRLLRAEQHAGERQPRTPVHVVSDDAELAQQVVFGRPEGHFLRGSSGTVDNVSGQETTGE